MGTVRLRTASPKERSQSKAKQTTKRESGERESGREAHCERAQRVGGVHFYVAKWTQQQQRVECCQRTCSNMRAWLPDCVRVCERVRACIGVRACACTTKPASNIRCLHRRRLRCCCRRCLCCCLSLVLNFSFSFWLAVAANGRVRLACFIFEYCEWTTTNTKLFSKRKRLRREKCEWKNSENIENTKYKRNAKCEITKAKCATKRRDRTCSVWSMQTNKRITK